MKSSEIIMYCLGIMTGMLIAIIVGGFSPDVHFAGLAFYGVIIICTAIMGIAYVNRKKWC
jgi:multisubunit Na+/H+ antiporter MnhB subunit